MWNISEVHLEHPENYVKYFVFFNKNQLQENRNGFIEWHTKTFLWMASHTKTIKNLMS